MADPTTIARFHWAVDRAISLPEICFGHCRREPGARWRVAADARVRKIKLQIMETLINPDEGRNHQLYTLSHET